MAAEKKVPLVQARRRLGRLADEVRRTGDPVVLTRRGRAVARLAPEPAGTGSPVDALGGLRGSITIVGSFADLVRDVRAIRLELASGVERKLTHVGRKGRR